ASALPRSQNCSVIAIPPWSCSTIRCSPSGCSTSAIWHSRLRLDDVPKAVRLPTLLRLNPQRLQKVGEVALVDENFSSLAILAEPQVRQTAFVAPLINEAHRDTHAFGDFADGLFFHRTPSKKIGTPL